MNKHTLDSTLIDDTLTWGRKELTDEVKLLGCGQRRTVGPN